MRLFYAPASPFVRKVVVCALELGLNEKIERLASAAHPVKRDPNVVEVNPLGKVPTLITAEGEPLYDSRVICEYIDSVAGGDRLIPSGPGKWRALREQALADGLLDAALLARYEIMARPTEYQWIDWRNAQIEKIVSAIDAFEKEASDLFGRVDVGTIGIGCALGYLDFRFPEIEWRRGRQTLADWFAAFDNRPSMANTRPFV